MTLPYKTVYHHSVEYPTNSSLLVARTHSDLMAILSVVDLQLFDRNASIVSISPLRAQLSSISPTTSRLAQNGIYLRIEIARVTISKRDRSKRFTRTVIYHFDRHSASRSASAIDQNYSQEQSHITSIDILRHDRTRSIARMRFSSDSMMTTL